MSNPLAAYVQSRFTLWQAARSEKERLWLQWYRTYRCLASPEDASRKSERSQIKIPASKEAVRNFVYSACSILFPSDPWFWLDPNTISQSPRPLAYAQYMRYILAKEQFEEKVDQMLTEDAIYGTTIARVLPCKKRRRRQVRKTVMDPMTLQPTASVVVPEETEYTYPKTDLISIYNYFTNPTATGTSRAESEGGIILHQLSESQLRQMMEEGTINKMPQTKESRANDDQALTDPVIGLQGMFGDIQQTSRAIPADLLDPNSGAGQTSIDQSNTLFQRLQMTGIQPNADANRFTVLEWHGYIPADIARDASQALGREITPGEKILFVHGTDVLNDEIDPPSWMVDRPIVSHRFESLPGEFYGLGIVESATGPQKALDATVRSRIDNLAFSLNSTFAVNEQRLVPGQNLDVYPGKVWRTFGDVREAIQQFTIGDVTGPTYPASQQYEQWIQSAHGVSPILGGRQSRGGEQTATEISTMQGNAAGFVAKVAKSFENSVLEPILRLYAAILFAFPNVEEQFTVIGPEGIQALSIESTDIPPDAQFIPMGSISHNAQAKAQKLQNALAVTANPLDAPFVNRPLLLKQYFDGLGLSNQDNLIFAPPVPPIVQSMMQAQLMQGGPSGSPPSGQPESGQPGSMLQAPSAPGGTPTEVA